MEEWLALSNLMVLISLSPLSVLPVLLESQ